MQNVHMWSPWVTSDEGTRCEGVVGVGQRCLCKHVHMWSPWVTSDEGTKYEGVVGVGQRCLCKYVQMWSPCTTSDEGTRCKGVVGVGQRCLCKNVHMWSPWVTSDEGTRCKELWVLVRGVCAKMCVCGLPGSLVMRIQYIYVDAGSPGCWSEVFLQKCAYVVSPGHH